jgi:hypothetical protein
MQYLQLNENASKVLWIRFWKVIDRGIMGKHGNEMKRKIFDAG